MKPLPDLFICSVDRSIKHLIPLLKTLQWFPVSPQDKYKLLNMTAKALQDFPSVNAVSPSPSPFLPLLQPHPTPSCIATHLAPSCLMEFAHDCFSCLNHSHLRQASHLILYSNMDLSVRPFQLGICRRSGPTFIVSHCIFFS